MPAGVMPSSGNAARPVPQWVWFAMGPDINRDPAARCATFRVLLLVRPQSVSHGRLLEIVPSSASGELGLTSRNRAAVCRNVRSQCDRDQSGRTWRCDRFRMRQQRDCRGPHTAAGPCRLGARPPCSGHGRQVGRARNTKSACSCASDLCASDLSVFRCQAPDAGQEEARVGRCAQHDELRLASRRWRDAADRIPVTRWGSPALVGGDRLASRSRTCNSNHTPEAPHRKHWTP